VLKVLTWRFFPRSCTSRPSIYPGSIKSRVLNSFDQSKGPTPSAQCLVLKSILDTHYKDLKQTLILRGAFARHLSDYFARISLLLVVLVSTALYMTYFSSLSILLGIAVIWAFVFVQIGFVVHDACHQQIFRVHRWNYLLSLLLGNFLLGISCGWWTHGHNLHHASPNSPEFDPDLESPVFTFASREPTKRAPVKRVFARYQAWLFLPLTLLEGYNVAIGSLTFLLKRKTNSWIFELVLVILSYVLYLEILFHAIGYRNALYFVLVHRGLFGMYLGLCFAPNHIGMPLQKAPNEAPSLQRQLAASRNIRTNALMSFILGGLDCQIEHHLFPNIPRRGLRAASRVTKDFCRSNHLSYHETGLFESYCEVFRHLKDVAKGTGEVKG